MAIQAQFPLYSTQDLMESGCGGLGNNSQQKQQQCFVESNRGSRFDSFMAVYDEKQREELDQLLRLQNERLRVLLQEQKRSQVALILKRVETKVVPLMRQKEEEIAKASKRNMELEEFMRRLEMENQVWQRVAQDNEAMIMSLNTTIEELKEKAMASSSFHNNGGGAAADDAESFCEDYRGIEEDGNGGTKKMMCKGCNSREVCVLFLPCRHLCSCKACAVFLDSCPLCQTLKKASIEALMV